MNGTDVESQKEQLASQFGRNLDPLAEYEPELEAADIDLFELFIIDILKPQDIAERTIDRYRFAYSVWRDHMATYGRHPACPTVEMVRTFIAAELEKGHKPSTVKMKVRRIGATYQYWQEESAFPHTQDFDPFKSAVKKTDWPAEESPEHPRIGLEEMQERVAQTTGIRGRAMMVLQLKCGLRAGELSNIRIPEIALDVPEITKFYPTLGTDDRLEGRQNAVFIPCDRPGNKSKRPRVLPLDGEIRTLLLRYLAIRPTGGMSDRLFLSDGYRAVDGSVINEPWRQAFPDIPEVSSHYGRHFMTTYFRIQVGLDRELVKYLRGDVTSSGEAPSAIDVYIHSYYEDIEAPYRQNIFRLNV